MKVTCQYSGEQYTLPEFLRTNLTYVHPIFTADTKQLLACTGCWARGELGEKERKLLFLSLLHTTELVTFRCAAYPADAVVQQNMEGLVRIVSWVDSIKNPALALPSFVITHETRQLPAIRYWLAAWWDARKDFEDGYKKSGEDKKQLDREKALERLIKTASKSTQDYIGLLSTWAMEASNTPLGLRAYWKQVLASRSTSIYSINTTDLEEVLEHMEENLPPGSIFATDFMKHLRLLVRKNKAGLSFGLGMSDDAELDYKALATTPFQIVEGDADTENANKMLIISSAPDEAPNHLNYPSRVAYLRAKIAWEFAQKARQYREDAEQEAQKISIQETIEAVDAEIDSEYELQIDLDPEVRAEEGEDDDTAD